MPVTFVCGAECQDNSSAAHWHSTTGSGQPPLLSSTGVRTGSYCFRQNNAGGNGARVFTMTNTSHAVLRFYLYIATLPDVTIELALFRNGTGSRSGQIRLDTAGKLRCRANSTDGSLSSALSTATWYRIELHTDMSTTSVIVDGRYDDNALGQAVVTGGAIDSMNTLRFGSLTGFTGDLYTDDIVVADSPADYPLGGGKVLGLYRPDADGTHSFTAGDFKYSGGANIATTATDVHTYIDDDLSSTADYVDQSVASTTSYLEVTMGDSSETVALRAVGWMWRLATSAGGTANTQLRSSQGGSDFTLFSGPLSGTTLDNTGQATAPTGVPWTNALWNATTFRWGYSNDVGPKPRLHSIMAELDFKDTLEPVGNMTQVIILG